MTTAFLLALTLLASPNAADSIVAGDSVRADVEIRATVMRHATDVRRCYQDEGLRRNPELAGQMELELTILPTGTVDSVAVSATDLAGPGRDELTVCVASRARSWRFERGPYAVEKVVFPFVFSPQEASKVEAASNSAD